MSRYRDTQLQGVKITHICFISDQTFSNLDVYSLMSPNVVLMLDHRPLLITVIYPLSPHDALKHHITSLKTDLILLQPRVLE